MNKHATESASMITWAASLALVLMAAIALTPSWPAVRAQQPQALPPEGMQLVIEQYSPNDQVTAITKNPIIDFCYNAGLLVVRQRADYLFASGFDGTTARAERALQPCDATRP